MNKTITNIRYYFLLACVLIMGSVSSFAQDATQSQSSSTHSASSTEATPANMDWVNNPWVWVGGGVLLLIILIAIFSSKKKSVSEVKRTTTVTTEVKND